MMEKVQSTRRNIIAFLAKDEKWHFIKEGDEVTLIKSCFSNCTYYIEVNRERISVDEDVYSEILEMDITKNDVC